MIFHVAGIEYEEQLVEKENWCVLRQAVPADRMPVLNVTTPNGDSSVYNERMAICRWLAKEYNLMGRSSSEYYLVEQMLSMMICKALSTSHGPFVTGSEVSFGDLFLLQTLDQLHCLDPSVLRSNYPELSTHRNAVYDACPRLVQYREKRPHIVI
ncbi:hypothetical protein FBUS_05428 [Fasciolopsis buskii]|uniref:GST N-terminal domain-containing protein n=1 Tax=Fasciolopsis buskii TaxID=27845 RepID=A0A8E0VH56_9TREM|nr:hypothetical protein FBUS_05428 [Fasciolopsis buski]